MGIPFGVSLFCGGAVLRTLRVGGALTRPRGAAPRRAPTRRGPRFSRETGGKRARGESFSPLDSLLWFFRTLQGVLSFSAWPAAHLSYARNGPPTGWAGWEGWFLRREEYFPPPKAFPLGGRCPSAHTGADEGATLYPTFPCRSRKGGPECRPNGIFLLLRWATRSPPHQSPPVTASPQGEAFAGGTSPQRKAFSPKPCSRKMRTQIRARTWAS